MRVLVIGYPLPDASIDNYSVMTAPSYFDYDALVVDPASITRDVRRLIEEGHEFEAHDGRPVLNAPTTASAVSAADQVRRRADETRRMLEAGATVIVLGRPNAVQGGLSGFEGCDRYSWLPAPGGLAWGTPYLKPAEGKTVRIAAEDHPAAALLREYRKEITYRLALDDRHAEVRSTGRVIATTGAGVPIAMEFPVLSGRVVFLPVFGDEPNTARSQISTAIVQLCQRLAEGSTGEEAPYWVRSMALPGLEQAEAEVETATAASAAADAHLSTVRAQHDEIEHHRRLLWADGHPFEGAVIDALRVLGFAVTGGLGQPLAITSEGAQTLVEMESAREQVVEWPYIRLQRRLEERLLKENERPGGLVIVNGFRLSAPDSRTDQVSTPLRVACENYRYTLLTTETLFNLVQRALGGAEPSDLAGIRRRLLGTPGLVTDEVALGTADAHSTDVGPIF
jgi:hypothetical protein